MITSHKFQRIFWPFRPSITTRQFFHPVVSLNGICLLKKYYSTLLTIIGIDGNNILFPHGFAIVEFESRES